MPISAPLTANKDRHMAVPLMPPGVSLLENMAIAKCKRVHLQSGSAFAYSWFYSQVRAAGPWNYKKRGRRKEKEFLEKFCGFIPVFPHEYECEEYNTKSSCNSSSKNKSE